METPSNLLFDCVTAAQVSVLSAPVPTNPATAYLASLGNDLSRATMRYALNRAAEIIDPSLVGRNGWSALPWGQMTAPVVRAMMSRYSGSPATRCKALAALKGVARAAWEMRQIPSDELERIRAIKGDIGTREIAGRYVPLGEITALLRVCADDSTAAGARDAAMISIAAATGARRAEIAGIEAENVRQSEPGRFEIKIIGKRNKQRTLHLTGNAALALADWVAVRDFAPGCNSSGRLFCSIRKGGKILPDTRLSTTAVDKILRKRCVQAHLTDLHWHDLRRTTTSDMLDAGADLSTVAGILGHSNVQTTARYDRRGERARIKASELIVVPYFPR